MDGFDLNALLRCMNELDEIKPKRHLYVGTWGALVELGGSKHIGTGVYAGTAPRRGNSVEREGFFLLLRPNKSPRLRWQRRCRLHYADEDKPFPPIACSIALRETTKIYRKCGATTLMPAVGLTLIDQRKLEGVDVVVYNGGTYLALRFDGGDQDLFVLVTPENFPD